METEEWKIDAAINEVKDGLTLDDDVGILENEQCSIIEVIEDDNGDSEFEVDENVRKNLLRCNTIASI